jgi:3-dehydroquinate dehydratase-2
MQSLDEDHMAQFLVLNGPNLNLLGSREPALYGTDTLADIIARLEQMAKARGAGLTAFQSNAEHDLINAIHGAKSAKVDAIIINAGAFTHTSIAIRDALAAVSIPFYEVHLSNVYARESFRSHSYLSSLAVGVIAGLGPIVYELALEAALRRFAAPR